VIRWAFSMFLSLVDMILEPPPGFEPGTFPLRRDCSGQLS
jgi:hypothetical protein